MEAVWQDLKYAARMLRRSPGFTTVAVLTLGLGIGANTAIFSVVRAVLLKPLPYPQPDRLMMIWEKVHLPFYQNDENAPAPGNFTAWRRESTAFDDMAAIDYRSYALTDQGEPQRIEGEAVSASLFSVFQVKALAGRVFTAAEDRPGRPQVIVLSYGLWASQFGSRPDVIGKSIRLDGRGYTVIGVLPRDTYFLDYDDQFWLPLALGPAEMANHGSHYLRVVARLKPGVTPAGAQAQLDGISRRLAEEFPASNTGVGVSLISLRDQLVGKVRPALLVLLGAVGFILLIACANVANLLLARAAFRGREMAVRVALGARPARIARQLLTESASLGMLGGALGLLLAFWGVEALRGISPLQLPRVSEIAVDRTVLAFSLMISLLVGVIFGLAPALQAARSNLQDSLKEGARESASRRGQRTRSVLVVAELALGVVVLVGAGLLLRTFWELQQVPLGFRPDGLLTFRVILRGERYARLQQRTDLFERALERIDTLPGVKSAAAVTFLPLTYAGGSSGFSIEGRAVATAGQLPFAGARIVTPGYFRTMEIPLIAGREFSWGDTPDSRLSIVINNAMVRTFWPDQNPIDQRIKLGRPDSPGPWWTIVGIVADVRESGLVTGPRPTMYFPSTQDESAGPSSRMPRDWVVRASGSPLALVPAIRQAIWALDKDLPISRVRTMEMVRDEKMAPQDLNLWLLGLFAALAIALASVGLYGVTSYAVVQRTREIGVRMALGAQRSDVMRLILGHGTKLAFAGVGCGLAGALATTRFMRSLLYGVGEADPLAFSGAAVLLVGVALLASYIPARRAARVDPMVALRYE